MLTVLTSATQLKGPEDSVTYLRQVLIGIWRLLNVLFVAFLPLGALSLSASAAMLELPDAVLVVPRSV